MDLLKIGVKILWIARYDYDTVSVLNAHTHEYFQMTYVFEGEGAFILGDKRFQLNQRTLLLIPPSILHNINSVTKTIKTYNIKFSISNQLFLNKITKIPSVIKPPSFFFERLQEIHRHGMEKLPFYKEKCLIEMADILIDLLRFEEEKSVSNDRPRHPRQKLNPHLQSALNYLYDNYHRDVSAQNLEKESCCSYRHLSSLFKKEFCMAPIAFLEKLRIEKAQDLIRHSDYELKKIAEIVGFHSVHYFTTVFKKLIGVPPGEWRKGENIGIGKDIFLEEGFINRMYIVSGNQAGNIS